jgi:hypothetical protein
MRILIREFIAPLGTFWCLSSAAFLIAWRDLPFSKEIHDTYSHGCHGSALFDWINRRGPIASPPL